jgi:cob(I)alamin adenosyltransferase
MIQVYTGDGKGKTTAALGLAIRAAGAGKHVFIGQFIKGRDYCELISLKKFRTIKVEQFGRGCFIKGKPALQDVKIACAGLNKVRNIAKKQKFDLIILDEINVALDLRLLKCQEVLELIRNISKKTEIVLTGRNAPAELIKVADLVSVIKDVKHYFRKGQIARRGIEY